jgi:hypothetical protein
VINLEQVAPKAGDPVVLPVPAAPQLKLRKNNLAKVAETEKPARRLRARKWPDQSNTNSGIGHHGSAIAC